MHSSSALIKLVPLSISEAELINILNALINFNLNTYIPFLNRRNGVFNRAEIILSVTIKKNDKDDEDDDKNLIISYRHIH